MGPGSPEHPAKGRGCSGEALGQDLMHRAGSGVSQRMNLLVFLSPGPAVAVDPSLVAF